MTRDFGCRCFLSVCALTLVLIFLIPTRAFGRAPQNASAPAEAQKPESSWPFASAASTPGSRLPMNRQLAEPLDNRQPIFLTPLTYGISQLQASVVVLADVNLDGKLDVVAAGQSYATGRSAVAVLPGNGDGTFQPGTSYDTGGYVATVAVADVNHDGKPDLVVSNLCGDVNCFTAGSVGVLFGNGDGTFLPVVLYNGFGGRVAIGDFNGDGNPDLALANSVANTVGVLLGNGDGTFQKPVFHEPGGSGVSSVAVADVNGDGRQDLLVVSNCNYLNCYTGTVGVLLGKGDGTFQPTVSYDAGADWAVALAVADVNKDGKLDVVVAGSMRGEVGVLLGKGDGTFSPAATYQSSGFGAESIAVADADGDGNLDLAMANNDFNTVDILLGNGDGTFQAYMSQPVWSRATWLAVADLNGDGKPDLAVGMFAIGILLNNSGAPPTTTSLVSSVNPAATGWGVTYTATLTSQSGGARTGTVAFQDDGKLAATVTLSGNQASYSASYSIPGQRGITATYSGELDKAGGSTSPVLVEVILKQSQTMTKVTGSGSPSLVGQTVGFTATVSSKYGPIPDGELVTFHDGTLAMASVPLASGTAAYSTSSLSAKTHTIKATYAGDARLKPSTGNVTQVVNRYSTSTALASSLNPSQFEQNVTFTAQVTSSGPTPTGKVMFLDGKHSLGSVQLKGGEAARTTSKLAVGTHSITAEYLGDAANGKSTSPVLYQVVQ